METNQILVPSGWKEETLEVKNPSPLGAMGTKGVTLPHLLREIDQTKLSLGTLSVSGLQCGRLRIGPVAWFSTKIRLKLMVPVWSTSSVFGRDPTTLWPPEPNEGGETRL